MNKLQRAENEERRERQLALTAGLVAGAQKILDGFIGACEWEISTAIDAGIILLTRAKNEQALARGLVLKAIIKRRQRAVRKRHKNSE